jgi:hypothetical protein
MDEVREARLHTAEEPRHRPRHPQLLRSGRQQEWLDPFRHERRVSRDGRDPEVALQIGEGEEQVRDVRLIARPASAEEVGVDDDHTAAS